MKKLLLILSIMVILFAATPAKAGSKEAVGPGLGWYVTEFPENTPFHMRHGWLFGTPPLEDPIGNHKYVMELDGVIISPDFQLAYDQVSGQLIRVYVFNFPDGMTGTHEFVHHYYGPCYQYLPDCKFPYKSVEVSTIYQTIEFTPE